MNHKKDHRKIAVAFLGMTLLFGILFGLVMPETGLAAVYINRTAPAASNTSAAPSIGLNPATWMPYFTYWITYAIYFLLGLAVSVAAYFIGAILSINIGIVGTTKSPTPVSTGFPITLSIANLGFVLAVIVIAIATILRSQTYGIKQILWKLVVAAILINFSLTIAGAIIGLADSFTLYFMKGISASPLDFAGQLASSFQPQQATTIGLKGLGINTQKLQGALAPSGFTTDIANSLRFIAALVFAILTFIIIIITLGALILMLLVRYVFLVVLLILMPFAWLGWIFPFLKDWWQKWWHNFLKWTFFAPIVTFFLWLAITIAREHAFGFQPSILQSQGNDPLAAIGNTLTTIFTPLITNLLQVVALAGLMLGGLFAANSLSITFAKNAYGAAEGGTKGLGSWVGRKGGGLLARGGATVSRPLGRVAPAGPPRQFTGIGRVLNPLMRGVHGARTGVAAVPTQLQTFADRMSSSPGLFKSIGLGIKNGSGLWGKKKKRKLTEEEIAAKEVEEGPEEEAAAQQPLRRPSPSQGQQQRTEEPRTIIIPPGAGEGYEGPREIIHFDAQGNPIP